MLTKIHHFGVVVRDADEALRFYRDALGLPVSADRVIEDQGVRGVLLPIGDSEIELLQPTRTDTGVARFLETRGEGPHHICFESDDVAAELQAVKAKGLELIDEVPRPGLAGNIGFCHPRAAHGVLVEFATPVEEHHPEPGTGVATATHVDHIVISSNDSDATASHFSEAFGIDIKRHMDRPGTGARLAFAKLREVVLEFAGPPNPTEGEKKARLAGIVLAVEDINKALDAVRSAGYEAEDPHDAVQDTAVLAAVKTGTCGVPFAFIQYGAR